MLRETNICNLDYELSVKVNFFRYKQKVKSMEKFNINNRKGKSLPKEIQSLKAYMNGVKYLSIARLSEARYLKVMPYPHREFQLSLSTAIDTNYSFSCEMFLKSIIIFHEGNAHGHNLKILYDQLPTDTKNLTKSQKMFSKESLKIEFEELLEMMGDSFVFFRYDNENTGYTTNLHFLRAFAEYLEIISFEIIKPYVKHGLY